jgi:hypothetical protein
VLAGQQTFVAVWEWAVDLPADLLAGFGLARGVPSERTIRRLVEGADPAALDAALSGWIANAQASADPPAGPRGLAFDGKTLKGARLFTETGAMSQEAVVEAVWHHGGIAAGHQRIIGGDEIAGACQMVCVPFAQVRGSLRGLGRTGSDADRGDRERGGPVRERVGRGPGTRWRVVGGWAGPAAAGAAGG